MTNPDIERLLSVCLGPLFKGNIGYLSRWFPGTLTNWGSIFDFVARVKKNPELASFHKNPKNFRRWQALKGLQNLNSRPDVIILLHSKDHSVAIKEAQQVNIPSIGIVDSNANGLGITYPIFGNDDSLEAQFLYMRIFADVIRKASSQKEQPGLSINPSLNEASPLFKDIFTNFLFYQ